VGAAFAAGWILGLAVLSTLVVFVLGSGVDPDTESGIEWFKVAVGIVFAVIMMIVLLLLGAKLLGAGLGGLASA
jgi:hypothetical protein